MWTFTTKNTQILKTWSGSSTCFSHKQNKKKSKSKKMNYISKCKIYPNLETISSSMLISSSTMDVSDSMIKCSLHSINNSMITWYFRNNLASRFCQLNRCQPACMKSNTSIRPFKSSMELPMRTHTISSKSELQSTNPYNILRVKKLLRLLVCWVIWD